LPRRRTLPLPGRRSLPLPGWWPRGLPRGTLPLPGRLPLPLRARQRTLPLPARPWLLTRGWTLPLAGRWRWPWSLIGQPLRPVRPPGRAVRPPGRAVRPPGRAVRPGHHSGTPDCVKYQKAELNQITVSRAASNPPNTGRVQPGRRGRRSESILAAKTP